MHCQNCGAAMEGSGSFCVYCGSRAGEAPASNQQQPAAPPPAQDQFSQPENNTFVRPEFTPENQTQQAPPAYYQPPPPPPKKRRGCLIAGIIGGVLIVIIAAIIAIAVFFIGDAFSTSHVDPTPPALGDHALVGTWTYIGSIFYVFRNDGRGSRGVSPLIANFEWEISATGYLRMDFGNGHIERWDYSITGDRVTLDSRGNQPLTGRFTYIRQGDAPQLTTVPDDDDDPEVTTTAPADPDRPPPGDGHPLVGAWLWDSTRTLYYTFNADGTGLQGFGQNRAFTWSVDEDDNLTMNFGRRDEDWTFSIDNDVLHIARRGHAGFHYYRDN